MRDVLKDSLGRSLRTLDEVSRLAAAWPVASGTAMASRAHVTGYTDGVVRLEVVDEAWMHEMMNVRGQLTRELARVAGVPVSGMHLEIKRPDRR